MKTFTVKIPAGIRNNEKIRLVGRGDLVAEVKIVVPKNLSQDEEKLYEKLKEVSTFNPR